MSQHRNLRRYALLLQTIVVTRFGLVFLRVLAMSCMWGVERFTPLDMRYIPVSIVFIMTLVGLAPWLLLKHIHVSRLTFWWYCITIGLGVFSIAEQINHTVVGDYFLASSGVVLFIAYFSLIHQSSRSKQWIHGDMIATGIAIAVMLDTSLRGVLWTLDLSWQQGLWPIVVVVILSILLVGLSFVIKPENGHHSVSSSSPLAWSIFLVGFYFFFVQHLYGDISRILQHTKWTIEMSLLFLLIGNFLGVMGTRLVSTHYRKGHLYYLPWVFMLGTVFVTFNISKWQYVAALYTVQVTNSIMIAIVLRSVFSLSGNKNIMRTRKIYLLNFWVYVLLVVLFYITGMSDRVFIIIGATVAIIFWKTIAKKTIQLNPNPLPQKAWRWIMIVLLFLVVIVPLRIKHDQTVIKPVSLTDRNISVMQWNIHQGIDVYGTLSLQEQAAFIREADVDIVSLNEVGRGSLWSGGVDTLLWLSHDLGMHAAYGPTVGSMSGNAFLSKLPFNDVESTIYSQQSIVPSGCIAINVLVDGQLLQLASTHVIFSKAYLTTEDFRKRNTGNSPDRVNIFHELVNACVDVSSPFLLLGDMNSTPDTEAIQILRTVGLVDAAESNMAGDIATWARSLQRIDYVFGSSEVDFESYQVIPGTWSDHFPIIVSLNLREEMMGAE